MATPERSTLAERMTKARLRTAAGRQGVPTPAARGGVSATAVRGGAPIAVPAFALPGASWQVPARPGEHLMLMPGQMHFGALAASLRTLLGSCVAVTIWHPQRCIGGMCHYLLPSRPRKSGEPLDGRYGDEALQAMLARVREADTDPRDYHAHLYGGADTMPEGSNLRFNVGERNIEQGWTLIDRCGFQLQGVDVGEDVPRTVTLTLASGEVQMRRGIGRAPPNAST